MNQSDKVSKILKQINTENSKIRVEESVVREVIETKNFALIDEFAPN